MSDAILSTILITLLRMIYKKYFRERGIVEKNTRQGVAYGFPWRPPYKRDPHTRAGAGPGAEILWEAQEVNDSLEVVFPRLVAAGWWPGGEVSRVSHPSRGRRSTDRPGADVEPCGKPAREPCVYKLARTRTTTRASTIVCASSLFVNACTSRRARLACASLSLSFSSFFSLFSLLKASD